MARFPVAEWQAEQTRLTVFPMPDATARSPEWWERVTGAEPDEQTMNPKKGSGAVQGAFGDGKLALRLEPDRVDWVLMPADRDLDELAESPQFPTLGSAPEVFNAFSVVAEKWLTADDTPSVARMAFGAVLVHPAENRRQGYERLPSYVPVRVDPESTDFMYQINLPPMQSATPVENLRLNRLSRWTVVAFRLFALRIVGTGMQPREIPDMFALRLELDMNTAPGFAGPIPRGQLIPVYRELVENGLKIATDGVIAQ